MPKLTDKQIEKYSRQIIIEKIGLSGQKKILNSSICIVGCGGLGSSAAQYLSMTGIGNIMLIDNDIINLSNLNRQTLFFERDIGKFKVDTLKKNLQEINPEAKINIGKKKINKKGEQHQQEFTEFIKKMLGGLDAQLEVEPNAERINFLLNKKDKKKLN